MGSFRLERVQELLKEVISEVLLEIKDPRMGFATITGVIISPDLRHARVFISTMGTDEEREHTMQALNNARGFVRREISGKIRLRHIPDVSFVHDGSIERGVKIIKLINEVTHSHDTPQE
jgi:ribosome-binding factor A